MKTLKSKLKFFFHLHLVLFLFIVITMTGCKSASPPTFVVAWMANGGNITSMESSDGTNWFNRTVHHTSLTDDKGPAIAHDDRLNWMLMWKNGPELQYNIGIGGIVVDSATVKGIQWSNASSIGKLNVLPDGSPSVAYGNGRWVVVFRNGVHLKVVRTQNNSTTSWETPVAVFHQDIVPRPATTSRDPAIGFGKVNGQDVFVLVYKAENSSEALASISEDGLIWSVPQVIGFVENDPAIAVSKDRIYVLLARSAGSGKRNFLFESLDGVSWTLIDELSGAALFITGPAFALGRDTAIITEVSSATTKIVSRIGKVTNGNSLRFGPHNFLRLDGSSIIENVANPSTRTALHFGKKAK